MSETDIGRAVASLERIRLTLAAIYANQLQDTDQPAKMRRLHHLGLSNVEIAAALGATANSVGVALHRARRRGKSKSRKRRNAK